MAEYYSGISQFRKDFGIKQDVTAQEKSFARYLNALSKNNPYLKTLFYAKGSMYDDTLAKAIQWESDQFGLRQEMAINSPAADASRQRQAGLNPDLMAGSSGSGSSGSSFDVPVTDMGGASNSAQVTSAESSVVSSVGGLVNDTISNLATTFSTMTGAVQSIKDFQNQFSFNQSQARIAGANADVAESISSDRILESNLRSAKSIADMYPYTLAEDGSAKIPTIEEVTQFLSDYGIDDPKRAGMVHSYMNNPAMKSVIDKMVEASAESHASATERTFEFYKALYDRQGQVQLLKADSDFYLSSIDKTINAVLSGDDSYIQNLISSAKNDALASSLSSSNDVSEQSNRKDQLSLIKDMLRRDHKAFKNGLLSVSYAVGELDKRIADLRSKPEGKTPYGRSLLSQLWAERNLMTSLGSSQLHLYAGIYTNALRNINVNTIFHGNPIVPDGTGKASDLVTKRLGIISYTFDHFLENPTSFDKWFTPLMYGVGNAIGAGARMFEKSKTPDSMPYTPPGWTTTY